MTGREAPFWKRLALDSELNDQFLAMVQEFVLLENSVDRIDASHSLDFQRGKVAILRAFESTAKLVARKKE